MREVQIIVSISDDGHKTVDGIGFEGDVCVTELGRFLDGKVLKEQKKPEYHSQRREVAKVGRSRRPG